MSAMSNSKKYFFISDLHLGLEEKEKELKKENLLISLLEKIKKEGDELFIVGDLFDYWFEYRRVYQKGFFKTLTALKALVDAGVKVHYFIGNHDFLHRDFFEKEIGVTLVHDSIEIELDGKRFFIAHGDGLVKNDLGYNILKMILRNMFIQFLYSLIHPDLGIWIASKTSKTSRNYTASKNYGEEDGLLESAKNKIDLGCDFVIFGHLHQRIKTNYKNGFYYNLGSWLDFPCYGLFSNGKFELHDWNSE